MTVENGKLITLSGVGRSEYTEKKSVFIGLAKRVSSEEDALAVVKSQKNEYPDARHHIFAYRLRGGAERYSDDGEPQGSGGIPMLEILRKNGIEDTVVVVTRYFGGTLLGTGGLSRAYAGTAKSAVDDAGIVVYGTFCEMEAVCSYNEYQRLLPELERAGALTDGTDFADRVTVRFALPATDADGFAARLTELFNGNVTPQKTGTRLDFCR